MKAGTTFEPLSRRGRAGARNNLLLSVILVVLIGTLYPIAAAAFGVQLSVGPPFFDMAGPVALVLVVALAAGPMICWMALGRMERVAQPTEDTVWSGVVRRCRNRCAGRVPKCASFPGLVLAIGLAAASVAPLWGRNPLRTPPFTWGMAVAHLGVAVSLFGMASDSAF